MPKTNETPELTRSLQVAAQDVMSGGAEGPSARIYLAGLLLLGAEEIRRLTETLAGAETAIARMHRAGPVEEEAAAVPVAKKGGRPKGPPCALDAGGRHRYGADGTCANMRGTGDVRQVCGAAKPAKKSDAAPAPANGQSAPVVTP